MERERPRTVILSTNDFEGGAAHAVYRLHRALQAGGIDSRLAVSRKYTDDATVVTVRGGRLGGILSMLGPVLEAGILRFHRRRKKAAWWPSLLRFLRPEDLPLVRRADLVLLTWVCGFLHPKSVGAILRTSKPVVWRLSDMWPFTGGCHYSGGCERYKASCGRCPLLGSRVEHDLSRLVWSSKRRHWDTGNLTLVSPSQWLAGCALRSTLFRDCRVEVIPTGVDTTRFRPVPRRTARSLLGLPQGRDLVLFGAADPGADPRKGGHLLPEIFEALRRRGRADSMGLVTFGTWVSPREVGVETIAVGKLRDDPSLALLYSACDVFVAPYMEDNLPNTIIESLACGTPAVAFRVGGVPELIVHEKNGYLAAPFDTEDMARGIRFVLDSDRQTMRKRTRREAERNFSLKRCAERYISLFRELLKNRG